MNKPCHRRIVSSSSSKAPATFSQLQPESKSTSVLIPVQAAHHNEMMSPAVTE
jgi:hypothetical protein